MNKRRNYLLSDNGVKSIAKQPPPAKRTRHPDGNSLYQTHDPKGSLYWVMAYRYQSDKDIKPKQKTLHIGSYKTASQTIDSKFTLEVSMKQARIERDQAKQLLADGIDPKEHREKEKNRFEQKHLFRVLANAYISKKQDATPKNV